MRTRGPMGRMVDRMTRAEKQDMFSLLARIEEGIHNASGRLDTPQTQVELEDVHISSGMRGLQAIDMGASNVTPLPISASHTISQEVEKQNRASSIRLREDIFLVETAQASNVIYVQDIVQGKKKLEDVKENSVVEFPETFYNYFEIVEERVKAS